MKQFDSTRIEFSPYGFSCEVWTPKRMLRPDRHNEIEFNLLTAGALTYLLGGRRTTIQAGRLGIFWAAIPHQIVDCEGEAPYYVVTLPLSEFLGIGLPCGFVNRILQGELVIDAAGHNSDEMKFHQWEIELRQRDRTFERAIWLEVQALLLRFARTSSSVPQYPDPTLSRADQLACYIARNYQEPLTAQKIAEAIGLHPNYAMSLFRRAFGTPMTTFITQHRISEAQRLLVTTGHSVLEIALSAGFQSLSRFNEAFKSTCGCSPREYRNAHRMLRDTGD